jgi:hypothetical protein
MARPTRPSSAPKKDWRARVSQGESTSGGRYFRRFFFSLLLVGLVVALVVLVLPGCLPDVRLVCLPIGDYEMTVSPVPYAARNVDEVKTRLDGQGAEVNIWDDLQTSKSLASLTNRLQAVASTPRTVLILYVSAHGVSESGKAYLLCSDYQPRTNPEGRFDFGELLQQIRVCRAKLKLLILDVAGIAVDPRLGFVVNEFPRIAEAKVRETADPDLYVLMSQGPLEQSHVTHAARRSLFNYYVVEGLRGAANRTEPNDYVVDLGELYEFVRNGVAARTARQTDERETQFPVLLRGGEGVCRNVPEGLTLLKVRPEPDKKQAAAEEEEKAAASGKKGDRPADKAVKSKAAAGSSDVAPGAAKSDPKEDPPPASEASPADPETKQPTAAADPSAPKDASDTAAPKKSVEAAERASPAAKTGKAKDAGGAGGERAAAKGEAASPKDKADSAKDKASAAEKAQPAAETPSAGAIEKKAAPSGVPPASENAAAAVPAMLGKAWQQRDRMRVRQGAAAWSPVDYAPHLWREYHELLLGFELRYRYGVPFKEERLKALRDLAEGTGAASGFGEASILGRLESARQSFLNNAQTLKKFEQARSEGLGEIEEAIKLRNDLMFAAAYYVRWHAQMATTSSAEIPFYRRISTLLDDEHLPKLVRLLDSLERPTATDSPEFQANMAELRKTKRQLEELRTDFEDGAYGLRRVAEDLLKSPPKRLADLHAIEGLLSIPLLASDLRARLIERLVRLDPPLELAAARQRSRPPTETVSALRLWERYGEQLRLEVALAKLADPEFRLAAEPTAAMAPHLAKSDGDVWEDYRKLGHGLGEFYQAVPDRIRRSYNSPQTADVQGAARLLRMIDARDVGGEWAERAVGIALRPPEPPPELRIRLAAPNKVTLARKNTWVPVDVELKVSGPCGDQARMRLDYEAGRIEVVDRDGSQPIAAGDQKSIPLDRTKTEQTASLRLNVRPKGDLAWRESLLALRATAEKKTASGEVRLELPPPDVVDVVVDRVLDLASGAKVAADRISGSQGGGREQSADVLCDAFPNRTTEYVISLVNRSGKAKRVAVELWAPPQITADSLAPLVGPLDRWGKPLPGYKRLASAADAELDAAGTPLAIPFTETKAEPKKEGADESKKPAEKTEKKEPPAADQPLVSRGLACVVYDTSVKEAKPEPQVRWLRFRPVAPRQYLQPAVKYDQGRVSIQVKPLEAELLPRLSEETAIKIDWDTLQAIDPNSRMSTHAEINAPDQVRELFADVPPKPGKEIPVQLAVDGYPRAFVYRVPTDRPLRIEELRDLRDVRILAPRGGDAFRIPLAAPIFVEFQVDAPADAFRNWGRDRPRDVVEVTMEVPGERSFAMQDKLQFYSDRQFEARVREIGTAGLLKVDARVRDFKVPLNPGELKNAEVAIRAAMSLTSAEGVAPAGRDVKTATVRVIFDAAKPTVKLIESPRVPVTQGNDATVIVEAKDSGSGVAKIECGLHEGDSAELEEKDKPAQLLPPNIQEQTRITLATKELKPGKYALLVRVTDKVGWKTAERLGYLEIAEPPPPPKPAESKMPALSSIAGRAVLGSPDANITWIGLKVRIKELGREVIAGSDGRFDFPEVPPGQYTLEAEGIGGNKIVKGTTNVTVTEKPAKVDLPME